MSSIRCDRVASLLMKEVSRIIRERLNDPRVEGAHLVSITVSPDLRLARIYYSTLRENQDEKAMQLGLDSAKSFIRKELKKVLRLRLLPELAFFFDPSIRHGDQMLGLLHKITPAEPEEPESSS